MRMYVRTDGWVKLCIFFWFCQNQSSSFRDQYVCPALWFMPFVIVKKVGSLEKVSQLFLLTSHFAKRCYKRICPSNWKIGAFLGRRRSAEKHFHNCYINCATQILCTQRNTPLLRPTVVVMTLINVATCNICCCCFSMFLLQDMTLFYTNVYCVW